MAWSQTLSPLDSSEATLYAGGLAVGSGGDVIVTGAMACRMVVAGQEVQPVHGLSADDTYLLRFSATGTLIWHRVLGGAAPPLWLSPPPSVVAFPDAYVLGGDFSTQLDLGAAPFLSAGMSDVFLAGIEMAGIDAWSERFGDDSQQSIHAMSGDGHAGLVVAGDDYGAMAFSDDSAPSPPSDDAHDAFVTKLDATGTAQWSKRLVADGPWPQVTGAAIDPGGVAVVGLADGDTDFGDGPVPAHGMFVLKLAP